MFSFDTIADKIKLIGSCVTGIVAACGGYVYFDGPIPASKAYVQDLTDKRLAPIILVQNTQSRSIDRFLLYQQQEALRKAKADPAAVTSQALQEHIRDLEALVRDTEARVRATGG
jgi:hypothetical protein